MFSVNHSMQIMPLPFEEEAIGNRFLLTVLERRTKLVSGVMGSSEKFAILLVVY